MPESVAIPVSISGAFGLLAWAVYRASISVCNAAAQAWTAWLAAQAADRLAVKDAQERLLQVMKEDAQHARQAAAESEVRHLALLNTTLLTLTAELKDHTVKSQAVMVAIQANNELLRGMMDPSP